MIQVFIVENDFRFVSDNRMASVNLKVKKKQKELLSTHLREQCCNFPLEKLGPHWPDGLANLASNHRQSWVRLTQVTMLRTSPNKPWLLNKT